MVRVLGAAERYRWYIDLGIPESTCCASARTIPTSSRTTRPARATSSSRTRGVGASSRASPTAPTSTSRSTPKFSGEDLTYFDQENDERYLPYVIEPAAGADRATLAFLLAAYDEDEARRRRQGREAHGAAARSAPRADQGRGAAAVEERDSSLPLADEVADALRPHFMIDVDDAGAIGRRYRRQDEVGTPLCVTVDFDSLDDHAVTVRDRDTMEQERVPIDRARRRAPTDRLGCEH